STCGLPLPLQPSYDFAAWTKPPPDLPITADFDLKDRNKYNCEVDEHNRLSTRTTKAYEAALKDGTVTQAMDIGLKLRAVYLYAPEEIEEIISSNDFERLVSPLPSNLALLVYRERKSRQQAEETRKEIEKREKEKEKENARLLEGSMVMPKPVPIDSVASRAVSAPDIFLAAIAYKQHPPIFWF
ncbi:hypothetical protein R3P38DRAFT_2379784, partial [Favolaschia claudopus]